MYALKVALTLGTLHVRGWGCFPNEGTGPMTIEDRPRSQWEDYENVKVAYKVALGELKAAGGVAVVVWILTV